MNDTTERIVLHVGMPKAASTAFQVWCDANRDALLARGVDYPSALPHNAIEPKHQVLVQALLRGDLSLLDGLAAPRAPVRLLSSEGLTGHLYDFALAVLERFRDRLHGTPVTLLVIDREREAWARSYWRQKVTNPPAPRFDHGTALTFEAFCETPRMRALMDRARLFADLAAAYGAQEVVTARVEDGWLDTALDALGIEDRDGFETPARTNEGLSEAAIELIRQVNGLGLTGDERDAVLALFQRHLDTNNVQIRQATERAERAGADLFKARGALRRLKAEDAPTAALLDDLCGGDSS